jgi:hypothetical protein
MSTPPSHLFSEEIVTKDHMLFGNVKFNVSCANHPALIGHLSLQRLHAKEIEPMSDYRVQAGEAQEDQFTAAIEKYTAPIPSSVYLGLAVASIFASITINAVQKEKANPALFVGQWVAPFLLLGIYNKMVKQHGSDAKAGN